ncbi:ATP-dependent helicase [Apiospora arundinis]|uniref:ATP-dependent helicase n=1 Tax=Apiospora arundinis TaxID=335852 RepID=A0ABR2IBJ7_9PEZI
MNHPPNTPSSKPSSQPSSQRRTSGTTSTPQQSHHVHAPFTHATPTSMNQMSKAERGRQLKPDSSAKSARLSRTPTPRSHPSQSATMDPHGDPDDSYEDYANCADYGTLSDGAPSSSPTNSRIAAAIANLSTSSPTHINGLPWESYMVALEAHGLPGAIHNLPGSPSHSQADFQPPLASQSQANARAVMENFLSVNEHEIAPEKRMDTPIQMRCELMEHQRVGLTWLVDQEKSKKKGALLADTMGLGKTIQALALILAHPSNDELHKTTLIVAPLALLKQWESEIRHKVERHYRLKTFIYHGQNKKGMTVSELMRYDVVLTTYGTVGQEFRRKRSNGLLAPDAMFHRIILDEAHNIKNRRSTASEAVCQLKSTYRICMTGTPFMNNTSEIYSLIRFLRIEPYRWWEEFSMDIDRPIRKWDDDEHSEAMQRLRKVIWSFTMRRSKQSMLDGKQILDLPTKQVVELKAEFNKDQATFYNNLEEEHRKKFENFSNSRSKKKNYMSILVLILRLRQVCSHPHLIKNFGIPDGAEIDSDGMIELASDLSQEVVEQIHSRPSFQCPICDDLTMDPVIISPCGHHICSQCFTAVMQVSALEGRDAGGPGSGSDTTCPCDGCPTEILPDRIICYTYFVRVHGPGVAIPKREEDYDSATCESETEDESTPSRRVKKERGMGANHVKKEEVQESKVPILKIEEATSSSLSAVSAVPASGLQGGSAKQEDAGPQKKALDPFAELDNLFAQADSFLARGRATMINRGKLAPTPPKPAPGRTIAAARSPTPKRPIKAEPASSSPPSAAKRTKKNDGGYVEKNKVITLADLKRESQRNATAKAAYLQRLRKDWVSSAKIDATMELLKRLRDEKPDEKILVFSLWTSFLDLLEVPLHDNKFAYARYDGSMRPAARDEAVKQFSRKPAATAPPAFGSNKKSSNIGTRVLLVSLTAGNAGLNLTAASQVVVLEPFWNPFVEDQAVDRAHRIGQGRDVTVHRVLVAGTIEDRILELQEKKRRLVGAALSEEGARGVGRLSLQEIRGLFGLRR